MKIRKNQIRDKCQSDKYYASIKYMAHSLRGKDRENFIITVCDLNIYLGCICALTCEKNATVEEYIWKTLNNYFQPRKIKFYDKSSGIWKENIKKLNSKDITYYLLACNVMGNMKAIKWYIYNHEVDKAIIIQLAKNMNEEQVFEAIVSYIVMIGMYIATWVAVVGEKTFYLKYQDGKYSYHHWFRKEKTFELDERITYKAREDGIVIYQDNKRLFLTSHGYTNAEFFGRTLLEKNIKCIKGEQYMEKYRDKGQEEI